MSDDDKSAAHPPGRPGLTLKLAQRLWRWQRGLTLGAQGIVLTPAHEVLLVRHGYRPGWHFPGGGVEKGESARAAVVRELREEAGIIPTVEPELLGLFTNFHAFPGDHIAVFVVRQFERPSVPQPNREIAESRFFPVSELPTGTVAGARRRLDEIYTGAPRRDLW